jgi:chromosome partitioning protein
MQVIITNSQKGGSGKTFLCKHLSVEASRSGGTVYLIDTDPQGTLTAWWQQRPTGGGVVLVDMPLDKVERGLDLLRANGADFVFIDTASGRLEIAQELFRLADYVLFPVQDSADDLAAVKVTADNIKAAGVPFQFVLTRVKPHTLITAQAAAVLSKHGQVANIFIRDRTAYKSRFESGKTVTEAEPRGAASVEMALLWQDIRAALNEEPPTEERKAANGN